MIRRNKVVIYMEDKHLGDVDTYVSTDIPGHLPGKTHMILDIISSKKENMNSVHEFQQDVLLALSGTTLNNAVDTGFSLSEKFSFKDKYGFDYNEVEDNKVGLCSYSSVILINMNAGDQVVDIEEGSTQFFLTNDDSELSFKPTEMTIKGNSMRVLYPVYHESDRSIFEKMTTYERVDYKF